MSLRRQVRDATLEVLDGLVQLLEVLLSSPLQRFVTSQSGFDACWLFKDHLHQESVLIPADRSDCVVDCSMFRWFSLTQDQLTSTGGVWQVCDQFAQLPKGQFVSQIFHFVEQKSSKNKT